MRRWSTATCGIYKGAGIATTGDRLVTVTPQHRVRTAKRK